MNTQERFRNVCLLPSGPMIIMHRLICLGRASTRTMLMVMTLERGAVGGSVPVDFAHMPPRLKPLLSRVTIGGHLRSVRPSPASERQLKGGGERETASGRAAPTEASLPTSSAATHHCRGCAAVHRQPSGTRAIAAAVLIAGTSSGTNRLVSGIRNSAGGAGASTPAVANVLERKQPK